jgi:hypothetical protein
LHRRHRRKSSARRRWPTSAAPSSPPARARTHDAYTCADLQRLLELKRAYDPDDVFGGGAGLRRNDELEHVAAA